MQSCIKCKINIRGDKRCCPLCFGELTGEPESPAFPVLPANKVSSVSAFKVGLFVCVLIEIIMGILFYATDFKIGIFPLIMAIAPVGLFDFAIAIYFRGNILKLVTAEGYVIMLLCFVVDRRTGFHGWSLSWVIPVLFICLTIAVSVIGSVTRRYLGDFVIYPFLNILLSLLQLIPVAKQINPFPLPAVICEGILLAFGAFILIFRFKDLTNASSRYLNL